MGLAKLGSDAFSVPCWSSALSQTSTKLLKAGLTALQCSGLGRLLAPASRGQGAVLMLHHVTPRQPARFAPNALLQVTPRFLEDVVGEVRRQGYDTVSLDDASRRIRGETTTERPFVCFTFDDGYRDNFEHALPVLERHGVPFAVYVATDFADGNGFLWWLVLERVIEARRFVSVQIAGERKTFRCNSDAEKTAAFDRIYWHLRTMEETKAREIVAELAAETGLDPLDPCRELVLSWDEVRQLAAHPLVTIGAHTKTHMALAKLSGPEAHAEMADSVARIEAEIGRPCRHFSYPYGSADAAGEREFEIAERLGLVSAVTTRKGVIGARAARQPMALPRLSVNGNFQHLRYFRALLSGVPFAAYDLVQRVRGERLPSYSEASASGFCIQRTSQAAGTTQANPPTT
jgi:peptidoglycan/xylan/chitin deacetylase (PgdA/CDA1 family)